MNPVSICFGFGSEGVQLRSIPSNLCCTLNVCTLARRFIFATNQIKCRRGKGQQYINDSKTLLRLHVSQMILQHELQSQNSFRIITNYFIISGKTQNDGEEEIEEIMRYINIKR